MAITVKCPACKQATLYHESNRYRPFCSERCKYIDLGDWASNIFTIQESEKQSNLNTFEDL